MDPDAPTTTMPGAGAGSLPVVALDGRTLTPRGVVDVARGRALARLTDDARERNVAAEHLVRDLIARGDLVYGVTTGVGVLRSRASLGEDRGDFQWRLVRSHAGGGGAPLTVEVVRAAMAVRVNQIGAGGAGVGEELVDGLLAVLRAGVTPFARELGSLGTGDLTVLAEIGLALGGEGDCWVGDDVVPSGQALAGHGIAPVRFGPRDGIGFMSSNAVSIGQASLVFTDAQRLLDSALGVAALSYEAADADPAVLDPRVHAARPHPGQVEVARRLRGLLGLGHDHHDLAAEAARRARARPIHDAFVFRCVPQVEGTLLDALRRLADVLAIELNVAGENALMLPRDGVGLPNGNFHAGVLTIALDSLRAAMSQSASLVAARVSALLDPDVTGLNPQLAADPGPDSGAMILEYTAHAAAAEVRSLAATAASQTTSVQSGIESHANFAGHSARRTSDALARMAVAVSAELVLAVRALRQRGTVPHGAGARSLYEAAAAVLSDDMADRPLSGDLEAARRLLFDDALWIEPEPGE
jgi:histidine ammonia-lyase